MKLKKKKKKKYYSRKKNYNIKNNNKLKLKKTKKKNKSKKKIIRKKEHFVLKIIKLQHFLKPEFNIRINLNLEKYIQAFFDRIEKTINEYRELKADEKRKRI